MNVKKIIAASTAAVVVASQALTAVSMAATTANYPEEWVKAVNFMAENGLSSTANSVEEYQPLATVKREAAAKFFVNFAKKFFNKQADTTKVCQFDDINEAQSWAVPYIVEACQMGLLKGADGKFMPKAELTKLQFLTVLARMAKNNPSIEPTQAFNLMKEEGVTKAASIKDTVRPVTRIELAILFMRAADKYAQPAQEQGNTNTQEQAGDIGSILGSILGDTEESNENTSDTENASDTEETSATTEEDTETTSEETETETTTEETNETVAGENKLVVALNPNTPAAQDIPYNASVVEFTRVDFTAGSEDVTVNSIKVARAGLGSDEDFDKVWLVVDGKRISTDKSINNDDYAEFNNLNLVIKAGETKTVSIMASMEVEQGSIKVNRLWIVEVKASSDVEGLPVWGNSMKTVDYSPAELTVTAKWTNTTVDVGDENDIVGEFKLEETEPNSNKDVIVKSIRLKNYGSASLSDLANIALYADNTKVSKKVYVDGDYVTFVLDDYVIEDGKSKIFDIKADIVDGDDGDDIQFEVKKKFDIYAVEKWTNIWASIKLESEPLVLKEYEINAGKVKISEDTSNPASQYVIPDTDNVLVLVAKADLDQPVRVDSLKLFVSAADIKSADLDNVDNEIDDINKTFDNVKLVVNNKVIDSVDKITDAGTKKNTVDTGDYYYFDSSFELHDNDLIKVYVDVKKEAKPGTYVKFKIDNTSDTNGNSKSLSDVEYVENGDSVDKDDFGGTAESNKLTIRNSAKGVSITRNDGYNNETFLAGQNQAPLMKFVVNAGTDSELKLRKFQFDFAFGWNATNKEYQNYTNCKLISNGKQVGTTEDVEHTNGGLNKILIENIDTDIPANEQQQFELRCDIDSAATDNSTVQVTLNLAQNKNDNTSSVIYDVNDNEVYLDSDVQWDISTVKSNAKLTITVDGDTPDEQIIVANTNDVEVARFKFEATDGDIKVKELLLWDNSTKKDTTRVKAYKLYVNNEEIASKTPSNWKAYFDLWNEWFTVPKDDNVVLVVKADLNDITDDDQTNEQIQLQINDLVAETVATSNDLTSATINGTANVDLDSDGTNGNGTDFAGTVWTNDATSAVIAEKQYIRKTQPTLSTVDVGTTKLTNGEQTIYKVQISADSSEDVYVASITFDISAKLNWHSLNAIYNSGIVSAIYRDDDGTNWYSGTDSQLKNFKLYVDNNNKTTDLSGGKCEAVSASKVRCTFKEDKDQIISAGWSKVFELKATVNNVQDNDYVTVQIKEDTAAQASDFNTVYTSSNNWFVWSDNAGSPHSRTTDDWFNGYKVNGLDTTSTTLEN